MVVMVVVGESPPASVERSPTLRRLRRNLAVHDEEFDLYVRLLNLYPERPNRWSVVDARTRASEILEMVDHKLWVMLMGRRVGCAFGLPRDAEWWSVWADYPYEVRAHRAIVLVPHHSPRCRYWNTDRFIPGKKMAWLLRDRCQVLGVEMPSAKVKGLRSEDVYAEISNHYPGPAVVASLWNLTPPPPREDPLPAPRPVGA